MVLQVGAEDLLTPIWVRTPGAAGGTGDGAGAQTGIREHVDCDWRSAASRINCCQARAPGKSVVQLLLQGRHWRRPLAPPPGEGRSGGKWLFQSHARAEERLEDLPVVFPCPLGGRRLSLLEKTGP